MASEAVADARHGGRIELRLRAVGAHRLEAAGQQRRQIVIARHLNEERQLLEQGDQFRPVIVLHRRCHRAALFLGGAGIGECGDGGFQHRLRHRNGSEATGLVDMGIHRSA